jgi:hypothetical protein
MMIKIVGFIFAALIATQAQATPTHLVCDMVNTEGTFIIEVTLDENNQEVTIYIPKTGNLVRRQAQFKADRVIVPDGDLVTYDFNRINGTLVRHSPLLKSDIDSGKCKVPTIVKRAF